MVIQHETFSKICYELLGDGDSGSCFVVLESPGLPQTFLTLSNDAEEALPINEDFIPSEFGNGMEVLNMIEEDWSGSIKVLCRPDIVDSHGPTRYIDFKNKQEFIEIIYEKFVNNNYTVKNSADITIRDLKLLEKLLNVKFDFSFEDFKNEF